MNFLSCVLARKSSPTSQSGNALVVPTAIGRSALERLPTEIHQKIYRYLLKADCVRQSYDFHLLHQIDFYRFQTNIFRVSSTIRFHAETTLYNENHFTVVKYDCPAILALLYSFEVAVVCAKSKIVEKFTRHSMKVTLKIPWSWLAVAVDPYLDEGGCDRSLLLVQNDLDSFVLMLKIFYWLNHDTSIPSYLALSFPFHPATARDIRIERILLEPFRGLNQNIHIVKVQHPIDIAFAEDLVQQMMYPIRWTRMAAWRFYDKMVAIKTTADICMRQGELKMALLKYEDCLKFLHVGAASLMARRIEDDGFVFSCKQLIFTCRVDLLLITLKGKTWDHGIVRQGKKKSAETVLKKSRSFVNQAPYMTTDANLRQRYYRALACVTLGRKEEALGFFRAALNLDPGNVVILNDMRWTKYNGSPDKMMGNWLSNEPLGVPPPKFLPSAQIENERYLLRRLGYKGDMLTQIPASADADTERMDRVARRYQEELRSADTNQAWDEWISTEGVETLQASTESLKFCNQLGNAYEGFVLVDRDRLVDTMRTLARRSSA
ncbi:MAG: hypothetical protein LQ342_002575 [Letrouitia transgressa]|nr:MAG: hypothetical protein LQ342_002575 [Letrouitia transgressa]